MPRLHAVVSIEFFKILCEQRQANAALEAQSGKASGS
jgi:hypothetical protein